MDFTFRLHGAVRAVLRGGFKLSMLSRPEVTEAWRTVQDQPVGRDFCPDTVLKRRHSHLGSWARDAAVCGQTHTSRVPGLGLGDVGEPSSPVPCLWVFSV